MNEHPGQEQISAFIDGEIAAPESDQLKSHFESCAGCAAMKSSLERASLALRALDLPEPTADQHRALRQAILDRPAKGRFFLARPAFAGGLALLALAAIAVVSLRPEQNKVASPTTSRLVAGESFDFADGSDVRSTVSRLPEVTGAQFTTDDIGTKQEGAYSAALGPSEAGSSGSSDLSHKEKAPSKSTAQNAAPSMDSQSNGTTCSRKILKTQPYPMIALVIRPATYNNQPARLLVYAWTASQTTNARLDHIQVWLVDPAKCAELAGDNLVNAAYHYSSFKRT